MSAIISECGLYRYSLRRGPPEDDFSPGGIDTLCWVMLNPSTADAKIDDQTIKQCKLFTRREFFRELLVVNLFAFRATDPKELKRAADPIGPRNNLHLMMALHECPKVIAAWGNHGGERGREVTEVLLKNRPDTWCLGRNKDGSPKHPLYLAASTPLVPFGQDL